MISLWSGSANTWDCDEMGHMNVRVYLEKAYEGLGTIAAEIGMSNAFRENALATLVPVDQHIRFIHEVMPGRPLIMQGCVTEWDDTTVTVFQVLRHKDGRPAAALRTRLQHTALPAFRAFPWNTNSLAQLERLLGTPPDDCSPRGLIPFGPSRTEAQTSMDHVLDSHAPEIGRGIVLPSHCDIHGRMLPAWFIGRISDSVPNLLFDWRQSLANGNPDQQIGAAVLEYRMRYRNWPRAGDRMTVHTSLVETQGKTHKLSHWAMDPDSGRAWLTSEAVAITFDLQARKAIAVPETKIAELAQLAPKGLSI
ncbi:MAG: thioesterase family protein [Pseudomonadota bacterium]